MRRRSLARDSKYRNTTRPTTVVTSMIPAMDTTLISKDTAMKTSFRLPLNVRREDRSRTAIKRGGKLQAKDAVDSPGRKSHIGNQLGGQGDLLGATEPLQLEMNLADRKCLGQGGLPCSRRQGSNRPRRVSSSVRSTLRSRSTRTVTWRHGFIRFEAHPHPRSVTGSRGVWVPLMPISVGCP